GLVLAVELEAHLELRAIDELPAVDLDVELLDLRDAQVAQRFGRGLAGVLRRIGPGLGAGADDLDQLVDGVALLGHDSSLEGYLWDGRTVLDANIPRSP